MFCLHIQYPINFVKWELWMEVLKLFRDVGNVYHLSFTFDNTDWSFHVKITLFLHFLLYSFKSVEFVGDVMAPTPSSMLKLKRPPPKFKKMKSLKQIVALRDQFYTQSFLSVIDLLFTALTERMTTYEFVWSKFGFLADIIKWKLARKTERRSSQIGECLSERFRW